MNYFVLKEFLSSYSLSSIAIASIVSIACSLFCKFNKNKMNNLIKTQLPFICSVFLSFAFDMLFVTKSFEFNDSTFFSGILSGSLSVIFTSSVKKFMRGEITTLSSKRALLIEGLIEGTVPSCKISATALILEELIVTHSTTGEDKNEDIMHQISSIIKERASENISDLEIYSLSELILKTVKSFK